MPSPRATPCGIEGIHRLISWPSYILLTAVLTACSTLPQSRPLEPQGSSASQVRLAEQCSIIAEMACKAVSLLSGGGAGQQQPTCTAFTASNGTRVERCGTAEAEPTTTAAVENNKTSAESARLSWTDNSDNESNFVIERCDEISVLEDSPNKTSSCVGEWSVLTSVSANTTSYVDHTVAENKTYIYRVKAINSIGSSAYSNQALFTTPSR